MPLIKIDQKGSYSLYPGLSVVASINEKDHGFWKSIYDSLLNCAHFSEFYTALPYESYHMTAIDLFTEEDISSKYWRHFIENNKNFFIKMHERLSDQTFIFKPQITIKRVLTTGVIQLELVIPSTQDNAVTELAGMHEVLDKKPDTYHINLAYQYKAMNTKETSQLHCALTKKLLEIINSREDLLNLNPPRLCFFNDMTAFIPWDGAKFPFSKTMTYPGFFNNTPSGLNDALNSKGLDTENSIKS